MIGNTTRQRCVAVGRLFAVVISSGCAADLFGPIEFPKMARGPDWIPNLYARVFHKPSAGKSSGRPRSISVRPRSYLEATVELDGLRQKIGIMDCDCNLKMGDMLEANVQACDDGSHLLRFAGGDGLLRDVNGNGRFEGLRGGKGPEREEEK